MALGSMFSGERGEALAAAIDEGIASGKVRLFAGTEAEVRGQLERYTGGAVAHADGGQLTTVESMRPRSRDRER